ncbi:MAG TPA: RHS repeat domain-containing protein [Candidatus Acidoferrum sp.]|nr:RHS repeat domain-containing protein [Candidatus Acidoferrum sp.]
MLQRTTGGITKTSTYNLDLAGHLTQVVYPTSRTVNYVYDNAGRAATATDSANGITYASGTCSSTGTAVCYAPQGALASAKIGVSSVFTGGLVLTNTYNNRLQPNELRVAPIYLFFIEPPDPNYPFLPGGSHQKVDGDLIKIGQNEEIDRLLRTLPQNATTYRFFLEKWNSFLYLAGGDVEFSWDDKKAL